MTQDDTIAGPSGAPALGTDRSEQPDFETGRPRLGGLAVPVQFDEAETKIIAAIADTLIPPGNGFPAPSEVGIANFFGRYTTPSGFRPKHYPYLGEDRLKSTLAVLGEEFADSDAQARTQVLQRMEKDDEEIFGQLRSLVYYGYYCADSVIAAIQREIPAGRDYHGPPLPYGYLHCIEDWDDESLATAGQGAGYIRTEDVVRVDLSKLTWLNGRTTKEEEK
ncbi:hypothetical protein CQY20_22155 [Mycolicibacterium agri]|uniref:Gluconate 2-dehydrogenase subunit 3 family protein n=1 Tax=Mycolicibacterium agri TaxID=36811 RepID=A0A2A7MV48_MYCAG|nr:gluconate 2-dehydrogenase subunit 3 family protein [Mycolicibacterium agri]PEG35377.1 hypothetical protein CQY20_22155 [Mycolicibacterium agri]GFG53513.1 hypothetical protein MAGR_49540 [Mycolicibacterium agri]